MIYIFKTTVKYKTQIRKLKSDLDSILPNAQWNFDLEDCDKILRIDSKDNCRQCVIALLHSFNFECVELK
jgi:hypothetical protein